MFWLVYCNRIVRIVSALSLALASTLVAAPHQSTDNTAQAKQHYQNAVATINKGDWQTAKNELQQAEKLAPGNALVHYDLALAYSHTGSPKSAQAELNKALQLGLPPEQKQAGEQLKKQLATSDVGEKTAPSTALSQAKSAEGEHPTTDIARWISSNSQFAVDEVTAATEVFPWRVSLDSHVQVEAANGDGCLLSLHFQRRDRFHDTAHWQQRDSLVPTAVLDPEKTRITTQPTPQRGTFYVLALQTTDMKSVLKTRAWEVDIKVPYSTDLSPRSWEGEASAQGYPQEALTPTAQIYLRDEDLASRMKKAFTELIQQCGGKPSVKDIY